MADAALRDAERSLAAITDRFVQWREWDEAHARWQAEYIRAGCPGRDPRRDPIRGDEVKGRNGSPRQVGKRWPLPLLKPVLWEPTWRGYGILNIDPLPVGALVLSVEMMRTNRDSGEPDLWRLVVRCPQAVGNVPGPVATPDGTLDCVVHEYPALGDDVPAGVEVEALTYWTGGSRARQRTREQRSSLANWRSWAKGGTVLRVAR